MRAVILFLLITSQVIATINDELEQISQKLGIKYVPEIPSITHQIEEWFSIYEAIDDRSDPSTIFIPGFVPKVIQAFFYIAPKVISPTQQIFQRKLLQQVAKDILAGQFYLQDFISLMMQLSHLINSNIPKQAEFILSGTFPNKMPDQQWHDPKTYSDSDYAKKTFDLQTKTFPAFLFFSGGELPFEPFLEGYFNHPSITLCLNVLALDVKGHAHNGIVNTSYALLLHDLRHSLAFVETLKSVHPDYCNFRHTLRQVFFKARSLEDESANLPLFLIMHEFMTPSMICHPGYSDTYKLIFQNACVISFLPSLEEVFMRSCFISLEEEIEKLTHITRVRVIRIKGKRRYFETPILELPQTKLTFKATAEVLRSERESSPLPSIESFEITFIPPRLPDSLSTVQVKGMSGCFVQIDSALRLQQSCLISVSDYLWMVAKYLKTEPVATLQGGIDALLSIMWSFYDRYITYVGN